MSARDDFAIATKRFLAERVAYRCSFPGCNASTLGPSEESAQAISRTGMACHINAASSGSGARRYDPNMTPEQRSSIENGIWMCYTHGKLIDTDETRFTVEMLRCWRDLAEFVAKIKQERGEDVKITPHNLSSFQLSKAEIPLPLDNSESQVIGDALHDALVHQLWGDEIAGHVRDVLIEIARNARQHGNSTKSILEIYPDSIWIRDNGLAFQAWDLDQCISGSGGSKAVKHLKIMHNDDVLIDYRRTATQYNLHIIRRITSQVVDVMRSQLEPCQAEVFRTEDGECAARLNLSNSCSRVFVSIPKYLVHSDLDDFLSSLEFELKDTDLEVVILAQDISMAVQKSLAAKLPKLKIVKVPS